MTMICATFLRRQLNFFVTSFRTVPTVFVPPYARAKHVLKDFDEEKGNKKFSLNSRKKALDEA